MGHSVLRRSWSGGRSCGLPRYFFDLAATSGSGPPNVAIFFLLLALLVGAEPALGLATRPVLRIEPGAHTAPIWKIATDREGRWLVTASEDKTVRVWDVASRRLVRTLRPPVGDERLRLYAVAMSPDGELVATGGGWTAGAGESNNVYVFRREDGTVLQRVGAAGEQTLALAWSPDGRYLAAAADRGQLTVYRVPGFAAGGQDARCRSRSSSVDFNRAGRLVTACDDGRLRLYEVSEGRVQLLATAQAPGGTLPRDARFSPDGTRIAVAYSDSRRISVLRADTLTLDLAPDIAGVDSGFLSSVAWSGEGGFLFAAGSWRVGGLARIRRWSGAGAGAYSDRATSLDAIRDLVALPKGGLASVAQTWPALDVDDAVGRGRRFGRRSIANLADREKLRVSADGMHVAFDYWGHSGVHGHFDQALRVVASGEPPDHLRAPRTAAAGLEFAPSDWQDTATPKLRGQPLAISRGEIARSLAIAPDGQRFVLGSTWYLRLFDRDGKVLWEVDPPGIAWGVNITGDGRYVVAAFGDGTIRWYAIADGAQRLALFPHPDGKRWVLWTPSGYYDSSPGAEDLIGWHVNRGPDDAADFFPASRLRSVFYRPDVVGRVLVAGSETEALRRANEERGRPPSVSTVLGHLPPVVEILAPSSGQRVSRSPVIVKFGVRTTADAPVTEIRVRANGQLLGLTGVLESLQRGGNVAEIGVPVGARDNEVSVVARNRHEWSAPATVKVVLDRGGSSVSVSPAAAAVLYVLAIGISNYENRDLELGYAAKDAEDFRAVIERQKGRLYRDVRVMHLEEKNATATEIRKGLAWLRREVTRHDVGMLFFAGHGDEDADGRYYLLPVNVDVRDLFSTAVPASDIVQVLGTLAGKAVFFMDTCRAGRVAETRRRRGPADTHRIINELAAAENGAVVYASSTGRQSSVEDSTWRNGAFTKALVEGLGGRAADPATGKITHQMLGVYLSNRVKELTDGQQHPVPRIDGAPDFPIAIAPQ
jgi:WD40 repeat protein